VLNPVEHKRAIIAMALCDEHSGCGCPRQAGRKDPPVDGP